MVMTMASTVLSLILLLALGAGQVCGGGRLYFGFLDYNNDDNRLEDGRCCEGEEGGGGHCLLPCDLIFQLSISGLDSVESLNRRPSEVPFRTSGQSRLPFLTADQDVINPLTFTFHHWPACLNVTVQIYDATQLPGDDGQLQLQLVDTMTLHVALATPSSFFTARQLLGQRDLRPSKLTVAIRYDCDNPGTAAHTSCPPTSLGPLTSGHENIMDCRYLQSSTPSSTTTTTSITTPSSTLPTTSATEAPTTLTSQTSTMSTTTATDSTTLETSVRERSSTSTSSTSSSSTMTSPTPSTSPPTLPHSTTRSAVSSTSDVTRLAPVTSREGNDDGPMEYWGVILGVVLGVLVVGAVIAFLIYYRRRKALIKWQEIYTVTPRLASSVEENGTAGRSDIPVATAD